MSRSYVIVASLCDHRVIEMAESPPITMENVWGVARVVSNCWYERSRKYPAPTYDVIASRAESLEALQQMLPALWGWNAMKVNPLVPVR